MKEFILPADITGMVAAGEFGFNIRNRDWLRRNRFTEPGNSVFDRSAIRSIVIVVFSCARIATVSDLAPRRLEDLTAVEKYFTISIPGVTAEVLRLRRG